MPGPLTDRQVELVQRSWEPMTRDYKSNGAELFAMMFRAYPDYQQKFELLKGFRNDEIAKSREMRSHGSTVLHAISAIVDTLDHWEFCARMIAKRAEDHRPRDVGMEHFSRLLNDFFPKLLKQKLGNRYDNETQAAWRATITAVLSAMEGTALK